MMRYLFLVLFIVFSASIVLANNFEKGVKEYNAGNYETALILFKKEVQSGNHSSGLYNNLGRTYYELDSLGKSIWAYQMALKVEPSNEKTIANLEFLESQISDDVELFEPSLLRWFKGMAFSRAQNFWVYLGIIFSVILSILILLNFKSKKNTVKTFSFYGSWAFGLLLLMSFVLSNYHSNRMSKYNNAVAINTTLDIYSNPTSSASVIASLNEGAVFEITNSTDGFVQIELGEIDGWVRSENIWKY